MHGNIILNNLCLFNLYPKLITFSYFKKNNRKSKKFEKLDANAWEGHYIIKTQLDITQVRSMTLDGKNFQKLNLASINEKNL